MTLSPTISNISFLVKEDLLWFIKFEEAFDWKIGLVWKCNLTCITVSLKGNMALRRFARATLRIDSCVVNNFNFGSFRRAPFKMETWSYVKFLRKRLWRNWRKLKITSNIFLFYFQIFVGSLCFVGTMNCTLYFWCIWLSKGNQTWIHVRYDLSTAVTIKNAVF
jgi:hypothetical protein